MADNDIAIKVEKVYKNFKLPHEKTNSIKSILTGVHKKRVKTFETQHALKDISFEIKKGEFFGIVGRNGSGKSTLLKIIAEIYRPTKGKVIKHGKLVPFIELGVGFNPELTGRENVFLNGALLGFSQKDMEAMYDDIVDFAELEKFMDQKLKNYSSGMQVRLAFSVATRAKADILLIDEVLAVGDADFQRKCFNYFKSLKKSDTTVIFVSHDMDAVREYCDRAAFIEKNELVKIGNPETIAQDYTKLFAGIMAEGAQTEDQNRWGEGKVKTDNVEIEIDEKTVKIRQTIHALDFAETFVAGIRIRSHSGVSVTGTNSKIERLKLNEMKAGDKVVVEWTAPNIFADGSYYIDVAINGPDGITVYDWWDEAASISIRKNRTVPYLVDPTFKVAVL